MNGDTGPLIAITSRKPSRYTKTWYICIFWIKKKLWKNSPEYQEQQLLVRKLSTEIESRFTEFDPKLWELVQAYLLEEDSCYDIEAKSAYLQGGADFMKILALANRKL